MRPLDRMLDGIADLAQSKAAETWATVWLTIISGSILVVSLFWLVHQLRAILG